MKRVIRLSLLVGIMFLVSGVFAQPGPMKAGPERMIKMLKLTDEQIAKITDLRLKMQKELLPLRSQMATLRNDLKLAMTAEKFDQAKVRKIIQDQQKVRGEIQLQRMLHHRAVRDLLTPEQQKKFDMHFLSRKGGKGGRGAKGCCEGPPKFGRGPHPERMGPGR